MKRIQPPYVSSYKDRHGVVRWRFRKPGLPQSQTRAAAFSDAWWDWYRAAQSGEPVQLGCSRTAPGSFSALVVAYYASADWRLLAATTQTTYRGILERLRSEHGAKPVAMLDKKGILILRDQKAGTPAAANNLLRMLRIIMRFAVERGWRRDDPTQGVKFLRYRSEGFHTWSEAEISKFEARWPIGSRERLAFDLLLCTAQRSGDVRRMGPQHIRERTITVRQQKTGATLELPVIDALAASLAARPSGHLTFLVTQHGQPYTAKGFGNWFSAACRSAGLPPGCSAHGLRKAAATRLADAGCNVHQIMAVTGHKTMSEVARYTAKASQRRGAEAAFAQVGRTKSEHELSNRLNRLDKVGGK